ncbi:permease-like cell division protein FtsX [Echinimonas agarilytica]|uniref:Cell division protein FtsX n=1 Tax=Echinimonas agarilytica TaxID=1215918 RepID=A0AA42B8M1_9GAMM|nr:permease-like cell division protein FtsX [Echinimonas agarilytica]MCM2681037.1 permease-like cell division protein FtsX [Echinimonas agarilytica]
MSLLFERRGEGATERKISRVQKLISWWISHLRQATSSLGDLWRTPAPSLMTILVLGFSLSLPASLYIVNKNGQRVAAQWENPAQISVFLKKNQSTDDIQRLVNDLATWTEVKKVEWLSKDDALMEFKETSGFGNALNYLDENPLPDVLVISPISSEQGTEHAEALLNELTSLPAVAMAKLDIQWLERLNAMVGLLENTFSGLATLLCLSVILIIGNTIRLSILSRRTEIEVMKLVGATDPFIQRPFLYAGVWYGVFGAFLSWIVIALLLWWLESAVNELTRLYDYPIQLSGLTLSESLLLIVIAASMGLMGSWLSVRQHIRAIEPV